MFYGNWSGPPPLALHEDRDDRWTRRVGSMYTAPASLPAALQSRGTKDVMDPSFYLP